MQFERLKRVFVLGMAFTASLLFTYFETNAFMSVAHLILQLGPLMAIPIFAHNSLAATVVALGMFFLAELTQVIPLRSRGLEIIRYPRVFSAALATMLVFNSIFRIAGTRMLSLQAMLSSFPVAIIEIYGLYLASLAGLLKHSKSMLKVYAVFLLGAVFETLVICAC